MYNYVEKATQNLTVRELSEFSKLYRKHAKKEKVAYLWWFLLGGLGGHRFYLRHYGTGLALLAITIFTCGLGAIAGWYDIVNIKRLTEKENKETVLNIIKVVKSK